MSSENPKNPDESAAWLAWTLHFIAVMLISSTGCRRIPQNAAPLPHSAYVWQSRWSSQVSAAVRVDPDPFERLVVLGVHVQWRSGQPHVLRPLIDWEALRESHKAIGFAVRIEVPPHEPTPDQVEIFLKATQQLLSDSKAHGVSCQEIHLDYDSPQKRLSGYRFWLPRFREAVRPTRLVITTLPAWLKESEFRRLIEHADSFVLQVHSVSTREPEEKAALFDLSRAKRWIEQASALGRPFLLSLPTYSALVGYDSQGQCLGMALDGEQPAWPPGIKIVEFRSDPDAIAGLVNELKTAHPVNMEGVMWYRFPVGGGEHNWQWPTINAVLAGRRPLRRMTPLGEGRGNGLVDIHVLNEGEVEDRFTGTIRISWKGNAPVDMEALSGWEFTKGVNEILMRRTALPSPRVLPGARSVCGWVRFNEKGPEVSLEMIP
ncbi:MAG: DUF3142 domain-containing protein [Verrucomicrobiota bacterium]